MFHLHSSPHKMHLRSTQAPSQTYPGFNMCVKLPSWSCSTEFLSRLHPWTVSIKVHKFASLPNRGCISIQSRSPYSHLTSIQAPILKSQLHPGRVSPQSRSWYLYLTSIPATSHLHPCPEKCSSATPRSHLKPILVRFISIQVLPHLHPGQKVLISSRSLYRLTSTEITYHILSVHEVCSSSPPMSSLNLIQSP